MGYGGKREGAGRKKGSKTLTLKDLIKQEDVERFVEFLLANYMEDSRLMIWMGDHLFGKAPQAVDVTSGGQPIGITPEERARLDALLDME